MKKVLSKQQDGWRTDEEESTMCVDMQNVETEFLCWAVPLLYFPCKSFYIN